MNRRALSMIICTAVAVSQASMISPVGAITFSDWTFSEFGNSSSSVYNTCSTDTTNNTVTINAGTSDFVSKGGKLDTNGSVNGDGLSYWYQAIDLANDFEISADVYVNYYKTTDSQTGFGIMARDAVETNGNATPSLCNTLLVGGYSNTGAIQAATRNVPTGATNAAFTPNTTNVNMAVGSTYNLKLKKTGTTYSVSVNGGEAINCGTDLLKGDNGKIYLGFFASRYASIKVSNINFKTSPGTSSSTGTSTTTGAGASVTTGAGASTSTGTSTTTGASTSTTTSAVTVAIKDVSPNIIVDASYSGTDGAQISGIPIFKTIKAAIDSISTSNTSEKIIFIKNGTYKEKIYLQTPYITLVGENAANTILTYDDANPTTVRTADQALWGTGTYGTQGSSSFNATSNAKNFKAVNLTFSNTFDESTTTASNKSAVAFFNQADNSVLVNCRIIGNQDTLCAWTNKQYYYNCYIQGDTDYVFGGAQAVFKHCELHTVNRTGKGYVSAPSTFTANVYGFLIKDCSLTSDSGMDGTVYLGRPWHPYGDTENSNVVYTNCYEGSHIAADGWTSMSGVDPLANDMYESNNYGPGANTTNSKRRQLTDVQKAQYTEANVLSNWDSASVATTLSAYIGNRFLSLSNLSSISTTNTGTMNNTTLPAVTVSINNVSPNIVVDASFTGTDGDQVNAIPTYKTITAAVGSVSPSNTTEKIIFVKNGTYHEKLTIATPYITLVGESATGTKITYDAANPLVMRTVDGGDGTVTYGTSGSASVTIKSSATGFKATNITFENSFDESTSTASNKSAVAMKCEADQSTFVNCRFIGNQDTLYPNKNKQYFYKCYIQGDVDFIFGGAQAVFEQCEIHSLNRSAGYATASSTLAASKYGFLMLNCNLTSDSNMDGQVYLGRPWQPNYPTNYCQTVYKNCNLGAHIISDGWGSMENTDKNNNNAKVTSYPADNFMYEYKNTGLGSNTTNANRRQLTDDKANDYSKANVLSGWDFSISANKSLASVGVSETVPNMNSDNSAPGKTGGTTTTTGAAVNLAEQVTWNSTEFGASTSLTNNTISVDSANKTVTLTAGSADGLTTGGKITGSQDGMSYYYTVIDPSKNFDFSANVKVNYFEKSTIDKQCGFGIMARDTIGNAGDASISNSNMALVGGYSGLVQSVFRNGVVDSSGAGAKMENVHKFADRPANDGTVTYKLRLRKTNTGYIASVDNGEEVIYYRPKQLEVLDNKHIYLGFFAARVASITVSNINLAESDVAKDPVGVQDPTTIITPAINITSTTSSGASIYNLNVVATTAGAVTVKQNGSEIYNGSIIANTTLSVPSTLVKGDNVFNVSYTSSQAGATLISQAYTVSYKTYGDENGNIYVSQNGTENGDGTENNPIDIYTAIKYTGDGQTIKVKGGTYNLTAPITIPKGNNGTANKMKMLTSYDGERAVFNFGKKSAGLTIWGDYWKVYGIDVTNTADAQRGLTVSGNNNLVENVKTYKNGDTGLQISGSSSDTIDKWPNNNLILNCESYDNMDAAMNNADGFAAKITVGYGNIFRGCISHNNCDDGWDLYTKSESGKIGPVMVENSIAYGNGTLTDGTVTKGDGNGFKLGGEGIAVTHTLKNSLSFNNNSNGITSNSNPAIIVENSIGADNKKSNIDLHYYTGANLQFKLTSDISVRTTTSGAADYAIDSVINDGNYFYDGTKTSNKSGVEIKKDYFKSMVMPTEVKMDAKGNIIWPDYMSPVNSTTAGGTTGGSTTGGTTGGTTAGETTTSSSSSHSHHNNSSSSSSSTSSTSSSNSVSNTASTTSTGSNTATSNGDVANKVIKLDNLSKEQAKAIEKEAIVNISAILGQGTQVSAAKEVQTTDGNKLTVTALVKDGKNVGLVIAAEKSSAITTVQVDTSAGEVKAVYKFVPLLNKYIEVTETVVIDKNTITLPTQANATYVAAADKLATNNVISEGWSKVDNSWYMVDKIGNPLTGWQKDSTGWVYLSSTNATMQTGWKQDGAKWYLLNNNGYMATGWMKTGDKWYYLNSDGGMASNTTVDGYTIGSDGALV